MSLILILKTLMFTRYSRVHMTSNKLFSGYYKKKLAFCSLYKNIQIFDMKALSRKRWEVKPASQNILGNIFLYILLTSYQYKDNSKNTWYLPLFDYTDFDLLHVLSVNVVIKMQDDNVMYNGKYKNILSTSSIQFNSGHKMHYSL